MFMAVRSIIYTRDKKHWILCGLITATVCAYELNNACKRITKIYLHTPLQFLDHIFRKNNDFFFSPLFLFCNYDLFSKISVLFYEECAMNGRAVSGQLLTYKQIIISTTHLHSLNV